MILEGAYMDEKTTGSNTAEESQATISTAEKTEAVQATQTPMSSIKPPVVEHRQVYGTAKTENLRDTGLWRWLIPVVAVALCAALFVVPLLILIPLLYGSIVAVSAGPEQEAQLLWLWIVMIVLEIAIAIVIARGILKIFVTQAGNYRS
jgi:hypothetical protein